MLDIIDLLTDVNLEIAENKINEYIVVHYTGNDGDTAENNAKYFSSVYRESSAHYFVDEKSIYRCVEDKNIAWHCGSSTYKHNKCRNYNSIGVELCSKKDEKGNYYFEKETIENAIILIKELMYKYNIPVNNVLRHYDVTGKKCPKPLLQNKKWSEFKSKLDFNYTTKTVKTLDEALDVLVEKVGINKEYWKSSCKHIKFLDILIIKIANQPLKENKNKDYSISLDEALNLINSKITIDKIYWKDSCKHIKNLEIFFDKVANSL